MVTPERPVADRVPQTLLLAYLVVWMGEGALRKWLLPALQQPLYFLRFAVVILAVLVALRRLRRPWPWGAHLGVAYVMTVVIITAVHLERGDQSLVQGVLGIRLWLEVVLMPLALGPMLRWPDVAAASRCVCWATLLVTPLALAQVLSRETSMVNKLLAADGSDNFENEGGVIRATGLFTSSLGHATFVILGAAVALSLATSARAAPRDRRLAIATLPAVLVLAFTSGSRSAVFGIVVLFALVALPAGSRGGGRRGQVIAVSVAACALALWLSPSIAPDATDALLVRLSGDGLVSEPQGRTALSLFGWLSMIGDSTSFGTGLGTTVLGLANVGAAHGAEQELQQWVTQLGPPLFVMALTGRIGATVWLLVLAVRELRCGQREPVILLGGVAYFLVVGAATSQGSVNGFVVLCVILIVGTVTDGGVVDKDACLEGYANPPGRSEVRPLP